MRSNFSVAGCALQLTLTWVIVIRTWTALPLPKKARGQLAIKTETLASSDWVVRCSILIEFVRIEPNWKQTYELNSLFLSLL